MTLQKLIITSVAAGLIITQTCEASEVESSQPELKELLERIEQKKKIFSAEYEKSKETARLLKKENEALKRTVQKLDSSNVAFARQADILFTQLEMLTAKESILKGKLDNLVEKWKEADRKRKELAEQYAALANRNSRNEEMLAEYPQAMQKLKQIKGTLESQMRVTAEFGGHLDHLTAKFRRQQQQHERAKQAIDKYRKTAAFYKTEYSRATSELKALKNQTGTNGEEIAWETPENTKRREQELAYYRASREETKQELVEQIDQLVKEKNEQETYQGELEELVTKLLNNLEGEKQRAGNLEYALHEMTRKAASLESHNEQMQSRIRAWEEEKETAHEEKRDEGNPPAA